MNKKQLRAEFKQLKRLKTSQRKEYQQFLKEHCPNLVGEIRNRWDNYQTILRDDDNFENLWHDLNNY